MAIPYAPRGVYQPDNTLIGLIQQAGRDAAQGQRAGGAIWGNTVNGLGQIAAGTIADIAAGKAQAAELARKEQLEAPIRQQQQRLGEMSLQKGERERAAAETESMRAQKLAEMFSGEAPPSPNAIIGLFADDPERGFNIVKGLNAIQPDSEKKIERYRDQATLLRDAVAGVGSTPEPLKPQAWTMARNSLISRGLISEDMVPADYSPEAFEMVANFGREPQKPANLQLVETGAGFQPYDPRAGKLGAVIAPPKPKAESTARTWVMRPGPDGKLAAVRVSESEILPGDKPANTREQGRPVTAGDAGRLAEIDNGILQAKQLKPELKTGTASKVGASLWNPITDLTGLGSESKQQQAKIDLVKQIIGKALEGGVLRKEDEVKYAKILPTIGDPDAVAQSKIDSLIALLEQRKDIKLSAIEDAGYDVTKFRERGGAKVSGPADPKAEDIFAKYDKKPR